MKRELKVKTDLFLRNKKAIKDEFKFESEYNYLLSSFLYADVNKELKSEKILESYKILKNNTSFFSDYRLLSLLLSSKMSLQKDPLKYFKDFTINFSKINKSKFYSSLYKMLSSIVLTDLEDEKDIDKIIEREKNIYQLMDKNHPILTGEEDIPFAMLLATSDLDEKDMVDEIEECYRLLNKCFKHSKDEIQSMAQILVLCDKPVEEKVSKVVDIYDLLSKNKKKVNRSFGLVVLATLVFIDKSAKEIVEDILEVDDYLASQKKTGLWPFGKYTRLLFSMLIVESVYGSSEGNKSKHLAIMSTLVTEQILTYVVLVNTVILYD